jgi:hypothetical protein
MLFVQFVALIYLSYTKKQMQDNDLFKTYTLQSALDKLDVIECFEQPTPNHPRGYARLCFLTFPYYPEHISLRPAQISTLGLFFFMI